MTEEFYKFLKSVFSTKDIEHEIEVSPETTKKFILNMNKSFNLNGLINRFASLKPQKAVRLDEFFDIPFDMLSFF